MAPFAGFENFADCVAQSKDQDSPEAFCAAIHKQATGKFPTENQEQMEGSKAVINMTEAEFQALIADFKEPSIQTYFQDTPTKIIRGVEIFTIGKHQDSLGREREWTSDELGSIIKAFSSGRPSMVPVKLGHTSAEHNEKVAKELGIPSSVLGGEGSNGHGAANLGKLLKVYRSNGTLIADLEVPEKVASLVESGLFTSVSSELNENYQDLGPAISGLALLGSERPALKGIKPLSDAQILAEENLVYIFSMGSNLEFVRDKPKPKRKRATGKYATMADGLHNYGISLEDFDIVLRRVREILQRGATAIPSLSDINELADRGKLSDREWIALRDFIKSGIVPPSDNPFKRGFPDLFSGYVDKLHHFIFGSGRAKPTPELIYQVPVTEEHTDESGNTTRRVIVQHVRASTISEARGVAFAALQSVLSGFGKVVSAGIGALAVTLVAERLGLIPKIRYNMGNPTVVNNPTGDQKRKAKNPVKGLTRVIGGDKFRIFTDSYADRVDNLHSYIGLPPIEPFGRLSNRPNVMIIDSIIKSQAEEVADLVRATSISISQAGLEFGVLLREGLKHSDRAFFFVKDVIKKLQRDGFNVIGEASGLLSEQVDALHNYNILAGLQLGAATITKLPLMIIGAITLKNVAFDVIAEDKEQNQQRPVRVWVETEAQVEPAVKKTLGSNWGIIGKVTAAIAGKIAGDQAKLGILGFGEYADALHSFSALDTVREWLQDKGFITTVLNLPDEDLDRISQEISHVHPELQPVVVRQNLEMLKQDARATSAARMEPTETFPFPKFTDNLHNFVSLKAIKTSTQAGVSEQFINYSLRDRETGVEIGTAMVTHFPEVKELVIDWIQGAIGIDGVRQFFRQLKTDFPSITRVIGDRASGANPGRIMALPLGRFGELADQLHEFHKVNWITRKRVKPHSHRGEAVSGAVGTAKGALSNPRVRTVSKRLAKLAIKRRFTEAKETSDALYE